MVEKLGNIILNAEEVLQREVKPCGNSAHIPVPKNLIGKQTIIFIKNDMEDEDFIREETK